MAGNCQGRDARPTDLRPFQNYEKNKGVQGSCHVLAGLLLMAVFWVLAGCSSTKAKPLEAGMQMPPSQDTTEVRTTRPYVLEVGDQLTITVWGFTDLAKTATINNSGDIYYPMVGRLPLAGKTLPEAQELLTAKLSKYIVDPQVDITTTMTRQEVFVMGEVNNPGRFPYTRPINLMEAIARASWFNTTAKKSNVILVRRAEGRYNVYRIDTTVVFKDQSPMLQTYLQPGDLVYVPPTFIADLARFMNNIQSILGPFITGEQMVVLWPQFKSALEGKGVMLGISTPTSASPTTTTTTTGTTTGTAGTP